MKTLKTLSAALAEVIPLVAIIRVGCDVVRRWRRGAPLVPAAREAVLKAMAAAAVRGGGRKTLKTTAASAVLCGASAAEAQDGRTRWTGCAR